VGLRDGMLLFGWRGGLAVGDEMLSVGLWWMVHHDDGDDDDDDDDDDTMMKGQQFTWIVG